VGENGRAISLDVFVVGAMDRRFGTSFAPMSVARQKSRMLSGTVSSVAIDSATRRGDVAAPVIE
jgi:hypothetical protein